MTDRQPMCAVCFRQPRAVGLKCQDCAAPAPKPTNAKHVADLPQDLSNYALTNFSASNSPPPNAKPWKEIRKLLWHKTRWPGVRDQTRLSHHLTKPGQPHPRQGQPIPTTPTAAERLAAIQASHHKTSDNNKQGDTMNNELIPVVTIAAEINQDPSLVAARVAEHIVIDPSSGLRCVPAGVCRWLIDEAARAVAASRERDQATRAAQAAQSRLLRERIAARAAEHAQLRASGVIGPDTPAIAIVAGGDKMERLNYKGRQFERYLKGESSYVPIRAHTEES